MKMKMYVWGSEMLKNYGHGYLIVVADNEDTARQIIRDQFDAWYKERYIVRREWDYDQEYKHDKLELLNKDLSKKPRVLDHLFIIGSE